MDVTPSPRFPPVRIEAAREAHAPTLIALHGFTGTGADFEPLREAMGANQAHWILPDLPGHGCFPASDSMDPYFLPATLRFIEAARRRVPEGSRPFLLAYSMGGRIALHYLRWARPLPAIILSASPGLEEPEERAQRRVRDAALIDPNRDTVQAFCEAWEARELIRPQTRVAEPLRSELRRRRRENRLGELHKALLGLGTGSLPSLWGALPTLPPFLLLTGVEDLKFGAIGARMAQMHPGIIHRTLPACGHAPHLEAPVTVAEILMAQAFA